LLVLGEPVEELRAILVVVGVCILGVEAVARR
jgi:hypothetical protein